MSHDNGALSAQFAFTSFHGLYVPSTKKKSIKQVSGLERNDFLYMERNQAHSLSMRKNYKMPSNNRYGGYGYSPKHDCLFQLTAVTTFLM